MINRAKTTRTMQAGEVAPALRIVQGSAGLFDRRTACSSAISARQAATRLGVGISTVYHMIRTHRLAGVKFEHAWWVELETAEFAPSVA